MAAKPLVITTTTGHLLYDDLESFLQCPEVMQATDLSQILNLVPIPNLKSELVARSKGLVAYAKNEGWITMPPCFQNRGTGAPGNLLEWLLGSQGKNKKFADVLCTEVKWHGGMSMLTLVHQEVEGGNESLRPLLEKYPTKIKPYRSFRHTVTPTGPWRAVVKGGRVIVCRRNPVPGDPEVYWKQSTLINRTLKFQDVILVCGRRLKDQIRFNCAYRLTGFKVDDFIHNIGNGFIRLDFDFRENPDSAVLRNHGTKLRLTSLRHIGQLWENVRLLESKPVDGINISDILCS